MSRINLRIIAKGSLARAAAIFAIAACMFPLAAAAQTPLAARVRALNDAADIRRLLVAYGHALDTRDWKAYSRLFTKDGTWNDTSDLPPGRMNNVVGDAATGPAAIFALMTKKLGEGGKPYDPNHIESTHLMTNFIVHVNGDMATAYSRWTVLAKTPDLKIYPRNSGRYNDTLVRENGQWKFKLRLVLHDIPNPE